MADNPFDQFDAPKANPFDQFDKPAATPAPSTPWLIATDANHPSKVGEWLKTAIDSGTFGLADYAQAGLNKLGVGDTDKSIDQLHQDSAAARKDIGPIASATADLAGYAVGPGKFAAGGKLAGKLGGGLLARIAGGAAEGSGSAVLGTVGHGDTDVGDNLKALALGGAIGAGTGVLPGGRGPKPVTPSTADLQTTAQQAFTPLKGKVYQAPGVSGVIDRTTSGMSAGDAMTMGQKLRDARDVMAREVADRPTVTADDVAKFNRELGKAAGGSDERQRIAQQYVAALNKGVGSKTEAAIKEANRASNIAKTSGDIEGWAAAPGSAPKAVRSALENNPDFYKTPPGLFDALNAVGKKAPAADPSISSEVGKAVGKHLLGMAAGGAAGYLFGGNPLEDIAGAALGAAVPSALGRFRSIPTRNALLAAQHLNATGMKVDPSVYTSMGLQIPGMLARQTGYGLGASGAF